MKKNQWLALLLALMLLLPAGAAFAASGDVNTPYSAPASTAGQSVYDLAVTLAGITYPLPVAYKSLTKNGWTWKEDSFTDPEKATIRGDMYTHVTLQNGKQEINVRVDNPTKDVIPLNTGMVTEIYLDASLCQFDIAGVTNDTTGAQLVSRLGGPFGHSIKNDTEESRLSYPGLTCKFDPDGKLLSVTIAKERVAPAFAASDAEKALRAGYVAPTSLSAAIKTSVFELFGNLYKLPAPLGVFVKNGWQVFEAETDEDGLVPAKNLCTVQLYRGDDMLLLAVRNDGAKAAKFFECPVYCVKKGSSFTVFDNARLSGGIKAGMTNAAFLALAGDEAGKLFDSQGKIGETQTYSYYLYDLDNGMNLSLYFDSEDDTLRCWELWVR